MSEYRSYDEGWFRDDELREASAIRQWEDDEAKADREMEDRERFGERDYRPLCPECGGRGVVAGPDEFGNYDGCDTCADEPDRCRRTEEALEERLGMEPSHASPGRLRLLEEYNRDEERGSA